MSNATQIAQVLARLAVANNPNTAIAAADPSIMPPQGPPQSTPYVPDPALEAQAQSQGQLPMHPLVSAIAQRLGLMSMLRNRANQQMTTDPNQIE